ncbi:beta-1 adrenergic receptor [Lepisosteus oculatus]|uniref:beta-1 adrenergic receptor n=1 Tax=Lepisosteus oculatus TaxID=7918 RepID=UPI00372472E2
MDTVGVIESTVRASMCFLGIMGNSMLVLHSLPSKRSHLKTSEVLFINLAASNLITNCLVDLPDTLADIAGRWFLGEAYCGIFLFCSDLSETSSVLTTLLISVFWYQKLVGSLKRGNAPVKLDSLGLSCGLLAASWGAALVFSVPLLSFVTVGSNRSASQDCQAHFPTHASKQTYEATYLTLANAVPVAFMVFTNLQIVITLLMQRKRIEALKKEARLQPAAERAQPTSTGPDSPRGFSSVSTPAGNQTPSSQALADPAGKGRLDALARAAAVAPPRSGNAPRQHPGAQVRAAMSVVAVASVFLVCWVTHLLLRIASNVNESSAIVEIASYIAASYTCIIPFIFLHGVKKLSCRCWK